MASDLQDPPELIPQFLARWEEGFKAVVAVKNESREAPLFFLIRKAYYRMIHRLAEFDIIENFTGFGLYDRQIIEYCRKLRDPYPYFRGIIADIGLPTAKIPFVQPRRKRGLTKNNFYTLYDIAMLGITNHSKVPLRIAAMAGFAMSAFSLLIGLAYLLYKLFFWDRFTVGVAPVVIGLVPFRLHPTFFHRRARRIHWIDPHPDHGSSAGRGAGADKFRCRRRRPGPSGIERNAPCRNRTNNPVIKSHLLCQLS